jgi:hypothetical protein
MNLFSTSRYVLFFLIFSYILQARPRSLDSIPEFREIRVSDQALYRENLQKSQQLLRSEKMDPAFSSALLEVMQSSIQKDNNLEHLNKVAEELENGMNFRLSRSELENLIADYFKNIRLQSELFYELTKSAHFDQIEKFNLICARIMEMLQTTSELEENLKNATSS